MGSAIASLMQRGLKVSDRSVARELATPGLFSRPDARRVFRQLLAESELRHL
jgi:hypothetical protein